MKKKAVIFLSAMLCALCSLAQPTTEQWRPAYHFTAPRNWLNDPNGPILIDGVYHLYYQHNPFENKWGHMSWGHATSKDLLRWKHLPVAMPEEVSADTTTWMFSGSVVSDSKNTSGFGRNGKAPLVAIYTADQPKQQKETQALAYSNDGGLSFEQFKGNPVIDLNLKDFRDPNVFWHEQSGRWVMAVALPAVHKVRFYGSADLKKWELLSDFGPTGYTKHVWECPFIVPLPVDGDPKRIKWLMMVSSGGDRGPAFMQYFVGDFDGKTFKSDQPEGGVLTVDHGDTFYAAIPYRLPGRQTLIGWLMPGKTETFPWRGQMSIPRDLGLVSTAEGTRLVQRPSQVVSAVVDRLGKGNMLLYRSLSIGKRKVLSAPGRFDQNCWWLDLELDIKRFGKQGIRLAADTIKGSFVEVGYDPVSQQLYVDCTSSEKGRREERNLLQTAPLAAPDGKVKISVLFDRSSLEVFGNDGRAVISTLVFPATGANALSVFSAHAAGVVPRLRLVNMTGL
ncbi:glycoside hydrolase [Pedobacter yulinensis]|uniref:Glycoside hydrolase n=1 Tax=Pedobacter yulinensis TaxID=2126353 RepID=A0A2T3HH23_9SPHI|nr:glycoside hydrolase family 32 protein [Pedobacter yulinensis]PST81681.1 glycoside hydrolase [Pedobacter yulinensis]